MIIFAFIILNYTATSQDIIKPECNPDCTSRNYPGQCDIQCDGVNGCNFYSSDAKIVCNERSNGLIVRYNATYEILCCDGEPYLRELNPAITSVNSSDVLVTQKAVWLEGRLVTMYVAVFE